MDPSGLETLLERWSDAHEQGRDLAAVELCAGRPELAEELERRIGEYRRVSALVRQLATIDDSDRTQEPLLDSLAAPSRRVAVVGPAEVPGYEIVRELGRGGTGVVYLARDLGLSRLVALKMLRWPARAGAEAVVRFRQEALAVARLSHPGVVQICEVGEVASPDGRSRPFMAMEYCPGGTLQERLAGKPLPGRAAARLAKALARTMHAVHEANVIHRDLKPANVLLSFSREPPARAQPALAGGSRLNGVVPKVSDFGLAKRLDAHDGALSGLVLGTPSYMAPEQAEGRTRDVGPLADVWALGAILYECLTGLPPFLGSGVLQTLRLVSRHDPVAPRQLNPACPRELERIALKCLRKERRERYPSAVALADDLARFLAR